MAQELHFEVSTYPFEKICNLTLFGGLYVSGVKFYNFWVCPNYSLHQELQFDGSTSLFMIDCNLTPFGASGVQPIVRITNLTSSNNFSGPKYPRTPSFAKNCIFRKSTLSSRILHMIKKRMHIICSILNDQFPNFLNPLISNHLDFLIFLLFNIPLTFSAEA